MAVPAVESGRVREPEMWRMALTGICATEAMETECSVDGAHRCLLCLKHNHSTFGERNGRIALAFAGGTCLTHGRARVLLPAAPVA